MAVVGKETVRVAGVRTLIQKGKVYEDSDPVVKSHPHLFESTEDAARRQQRPQSTAEMGDRSMTARNIEQATAAPGEKRAVDLSCEHCDFKARSPAGLARHSKAHKGDE